MPYRITLPDGSTRQSRTIRIALTVAYGLMGTAGAFLLISPIFQEAYSWRIEVMAWFLIVGGVLACIGAASQRWWGEFTGLPLLSAAFAVFGVITAAENYEFDAFLSLANGGLLWAVASLLVARWRVPFAWYRLALALGKGRVDE